MYNQDCEKASFKSKKQFGPSFHFKTKRMHLKDYYLADDKESYQQFKENYFFHNTNNENMCSEVSRNWIKPSLSSDDSRVPLALYDSNLNCSLNIENAFETKDSIELNSGFWEYKSLSKRGLNKLSSEYVPNCPSVIELSFQDKLTRNSNCSETVILTKEDSNYGSMTTLKCSKSGRIPNGMKYKTELCTNFMEDRECPFAGRCRFAHGYDELNKKFIINNKFKSRICEPYHKKLFCKYGSRCLFQHYNFEKDFSWSYYNNTLLSGFLLKELVDSRELYKVFRKLRIIYKDNHSLVTEKLILTADPNQKLQTAIGTDIYKRLPVFAELTEDSDEFNKCMCSKPFKVEVLDSLRDYELIIWKCFVKDFIFDKVLKVIKTCYLGKRRNSNIELPVHQYMMITHLCDALIKIYRYPILKGDLKVLDHVI